MSSIDNEPAVRIFLSYHKRNRALADAVANAIDEEIRVSWPAGPRIEIWYDLAIEAGDVWDPKTQNELERADIILFLVAPACLDATYMWSDEFPVALERFRRGAGRVRLIPVLYADIKAPILTNRFTRGLNWIPEKPHDQIADVWFKKVAEGIRPTIAGVLSQSPPPAQRMISALDRARLCLDEAKKMFGSAGTSGFFGSVLASELQHALDCIEASFVLSGRDRVRASQVWEGRIRQSRILLRESLPSHAICLSQLSDALDELSTFTQLEDAWPVQPHIESSLPVTVENRREVESLRNDMATTREILAELATSPSPPTSVEKAARDLTVEVGSARASLAEALLEDQPIDPTALTTELDGLNGLASSFEQTLQELGTSASTEGRKISPQLLNVASMALGTALRLTAPVGTSPEAAEAQSPSVEGSIEPSNLRVGPPLRSRFKRVALLGIGGAGTNAVDNMIRSGIPNLRVLVANTNANKLNASRAPHKIFLGTTVGRDVRGNAAEGAKAALESENEIKDALKGIELLFIAAGMGGGTGSGAAPAIARIAQDMGIITVGVMTLPFDFEGRRRMQVAYESAANFQRFLNSFVVLDNQLLFAVADKDTTFGQAFELADRALYASLKSVFGIASSSNLDTGQLAQVLQFFRRAGECAIATGSFEHDDDPEFAVSKAFNRPYLSNRSIRGSTAAIGSVFAAPSPDVGRELFATRQAIMSQLSDGCTLIFGANVNEPEDRQTSFYVMAKVVPLGDRH